MNFDDDLHETKMMNFESKRVEEVDVCLQKLRLRVVEEMTKQIELEQEERRVVAKYLM